MESTVPVAARRRVSHEERTQREHELNRALEAARALQERLELADLNGHARGVHRIRDDVAGRLADLATEDLFPNEVGGTPDPVVGDYLQPTVADASDIGVQKRRERFLLLDDPPCQCLAE